MYYKIQPEQIQLHTFSSPSGHLAFSSGSNYVYANIADMLTGNFNITGSLSINGQRVVFYDKSNSVSTGVGNFAFGGVSNTVGGTGNLLLNGDSNTILGKDNLVINGDLNTFSESSEKNTVLAGRSTSFSSGTTGAVILKDFGSYSVPDNGSNTLTVAFESGVFFEGSDLSLKNSNFYLDPSSSGVFSGGCNFFGVLQKNGENIAVTGDIGITSGVLDTRLISTGSSLSSRIETTGSYLSTKIDTLSGTLSGYTQQTGSDLSLRIDNSGSSLSSRIVSTGASLSSRVGLTGDYLVAALTLTGSDLYSSIVSTGSSLSSRIVSTGTSLYSKMDIASGYLDAKIDLASGTINTRLISTGSSLSSRIDSTGSYAVGLSSSLGSAFFKTGDQSVTGENTFIRNTIFSESLYLKGNSGVLSGVSGASALVPTTSGSSIGNRGLISYSGQFLYLKISDNPHHWLRISGDLEWT